MDLDHIMDQKGKGNEIPTLAQSPHNAKQGTMPPENPHPVPWGAVRQSAPGGSQGLPDPVEPLVNIAQQTMLSIPAQGQANEYDFFFIYLIQEINNHTMGFKSFREAAKKCNLSRPCINAAFVDFHRICDSLLNRHPSNRTLRNRMIDHLSPDEGNDQPTLSQRGGRFRSLMGVVCALSGLTHELMLLIQEHAGNLDAEHAASSRRDVYEFITMTEFMCKHIAFNVHTL
jgi:hypothetical protein